MCNFRRGKVRYIHHMDFALKRERWLSCNLLRLGVKADVNTTVILEDKDLQLSHYFPSP